MRMAAAWCPWQTMMHPQAWGHLLWHCPQPCCPYVIWTWSCELTRNVYLEGSDGVQVRLYGSVGLSWNTFMDADKWVIMVEKYISAEERFVCRDTQKCLQTKMYSNLFICRGLSASSKWKEQEHLLEIITILDKHFRGEFHIFKCPTRMFSHSILQTSMDTLTCFSYTEMMVAGTCAIQIWHMLINLCISSYVVFRRLGQKLHLLHVQT